MFAYVCHALQSVLFACTTGSCTVLRGGQGISYTEAAPDGSGSIEFAAQIFVAAAVSLPYPNLQKDPESCFGEQVVTSG